MKIHAQNSHLNLLFNVSILWALLSVTPPLEAAAVITATTTATPAVGADAEPGETVSYSITVTNDPTEAAQAVGYSVTLDANVTLTGGTIKTTPVALDDSYTGILGYRLRSGRQLACWPMMSTLRTVPAWMGFPQCSRLSILG